MSHEILQSQISSMSRALRQFRHDMCGLSQAKMRINKIQMEAWRVECQLEKLAHSVFLHEKQSRRASGK